MPPRKTTKAHKWTFRARFRRGAFGWRSDLPIKRIREALSEIKKVARKDPVLGAEGAVLLLEKLSPALEHVDSSSGAIGSAVYNAIETLVPIIAKASTDNDRNGKKQHDKWLERLWDAIQNDGMTYIETLTDHWGELCATRERASQWADKFIEVVRINWSPQTPPGGYFSGTTACLSALHKAQRFDDIFELLDLAPYKSWHQRVWGVRALAAMGKVREAIEYAEDTRGLNEPAHAIAETCEEILLANGQPDEAYERYAFMANEKSTYLATFRAITRKYPHKLATDILNDLAANTPGGKGKWFAAAKSARLYDLAISFANSSGSEPKTLMRAARDMAASEPQFALETGMAALKGLAAGRGYEVTRLDVKAAYDHTMQAARNADCEHKTIERIRKLLTDGSAPEKFVVEVLERLLEPSN